MKLTIFGTGYAGLVTGTCLAQVGHDVMCIDIDEKKINDLKKGIIPIYEPGLEELVVKNTAAGRLVFSTDAKAGIKHGVAIFSAVGTPPDRENKNKADLKYVETVAKTFGQEISEYKIFINKSTVPVGTGKKCHEIIKREIYSRDKDTEFDMASNPEFLREGSAVSDFLKPDRIVLGCESSRSQKVLEEIYRPFERSNTELLFTDIPSAELIKYAANSFLATKISFINEIANFSELVGADILDISKGLGLDPRIGKNFLSSGAGYGGSCLPKDVKALVETGKEYNFDFNIVREADRVNEAQKHIILTKLKTYISNLKDKNIALWGLAFKPDTDDVREAVSMTVIQELIKTDIHSLKVFDPVATDAMQREIPKNSKITYCKTNYQAIEDADVLILLTEWDEFFAPDWKRIKKSMRGKLIIDGRNIWNKNILKNYDFTYVGIGR